MARRGFARGLSGSTFAHVVVLCCLSRAAQFKGDVENNSPGRRGHLFQERVLASVPSPEGGHGEFVSAA